MKLYTIQSGSRGNCTILTDKCGGQLIIDCGVKYETILQHCIPKEVDGVLITHEHKDHSLSKDKLIKSGFEVIDYTSIKDGQLIQLNNWSIRVMELKHNVPCFGFLIGNKIERKVFAYITDTTIIPNIPTNVDCVMIECNYDETIVQDKLSNGEQLNLGCRNHLSISDIENWAKLKQELFFRLVLAHTSTTGLFSKYDAIRRLQPYSVLPIEIAYKDFSLEF